MTKKNIYYPLMIFFLCTLSYSQKKDFKKEPFNKEDGFEVYEKYIFHRSKKGKLKINKRNLKTIYNNTKSSDDDYFDELRSFTYVLPNKNVIGKNLSFSERANVYGYAIEYLLKCQEKFKIDDTYKNKEIILWTLRPKYRNAYNKEFKKNNYYGLKRLKKNHLKNFTPFNDPTDNKHKKIVY